MIIAIDFDGTIAEEKNFPDCGDPVPGAIETIKHLYGHGGITLILNTLREGKNLALAIQWLIDYNIAGCFSLINQNSKIEIYRYGNDPRKIAADLYIDDRAFGWNGEESWNKLKRIFS